MPIDTQKLFNIAAFTVGWKFLDNGRKQGEVDCYGLFLFVMKQLGYRIPDYGSTDYSHLQVIIEKNYQSVADSIKDSDVQIGDIVLFPSHIGVLLDNNRFLHCSRQHGVVIGKLDRIPYANMDKSFCRIKEQFYDPDNVYS